MLKIKFQELNVTAPTRRHEMVIFTDGTGYERWYRNGNLWDETPIIGATFVNGHPDWISYGKTTMMGGIKRV